MVNMNENLVGNVAEGLPVDENEITVEEVAQEAEENGPGTKDDGPLAPEPEVVLESVPLGASAPVKATGLGPAQDEGRFVVRKACDV